MLVEQSDPVNAAVAAIIQPAADLATGLKNGTARRAVPNEDAVRPAQRRGHRRRRGRTLRWVLRECGDISNSRWAIEENRRRAADRLACRHHSAGRIDHREDVRAVAR